MNSMCHSLKQTIRIIFIFVISTIVPGFALAADYSYSVSGPVHKINMTAGETQSTVVPPNLKPACRGGRFFVTNDFVRPPGPNTIVGRDLNNPDASDIHPTFDSDPYSHDSNHYWGTNDHDIVTLSNGDILLIWGVHSKAPLNPKPAWFDFTYKGTFGPGARRGMMVWRSVDCGQTFQYETEVDVAAIGDGSCAMPQPAGSTVPTGTAAQPNYANGGVDGQLVKVDLSNNNVYLMVQCVGYKQDLSQKKHFILSKNHVNETFVLRSTNEGATWDSLGTLPTTAWRYGIAPLNSGSLLAFGRYNDVSFGTKENNGQYNLPTSEQPSVADYGYDSGFNFNPLTRIGKTGIDVNIVAHTLITRVPNSSKVLIAYPATLGNNVLGPPKTYGYQVFMYDRSNNQFFQGEPIYPLAHTGNNFLMHMAAIDPGSGPILLYWYDINADTLKGTVRGRLITGDNEFSEDFSVANDNPTTPHVFNLQPIIAKIGSTPKEYWFGDYKTAGGFAPRLIANTNFPVYHYYPMWDEPDGTVRFSQVIVNGRPSINANFKNLNYYGIPKPRIGPPPVEFRNRILTQLERRNIEEEERDESREVRRP